MQKKFKLAEVSKDFNIPAKELCNTLIKIDGNTARKVTASITLEDYNLLLAYLSSAGQVTDNFNAFKADKTKTVGKKIVSEPEKEPKKEPKKEAKKETKKEIKKEEHIKPTITETIKSAVKGPATSLKSLVKANVEKAKEEKKQFSYSTKKADLGEVIAPRSSEAKAQLQAKQETPSQPAKSVEIKTQNQNKPQPQQNRNQNQQQPQNQNRNQTQNQNKFQPKSTPIQSNQTNKAPQGVQKSVQKTSQLDKFAKRAENQPIKPKQPKQEKLVSQKPSHGERTKFVTDKISDAATVERKQHIVDTRGSYVELDKYNERYEQIAPADRRKDEYVKKQKIQQKTPQRGKPFSAKRETEAQKMQRLELEKARKQQLKISIPETIIVSELASRLKVNVSQVIKKLMGLGIMAAQNQDVDYDTAAIIAEELGAKVEKEITVTIEERLIETDIDNPEDLEGRAPVVVVMGHVDHGKTSLLDKIRHANVVAGEAGGITQHIGAYRVTVGEGDDRRKITFLDTPGHEAFTSMRARGAQATDIAILVVAADDGIMPQTIEAINHAKAAGVSIIVAINKMDKDGANPDRIKQELTEHGLVIEEWGGDIICCEVSAKTGLGIDTLLENVILVADVLELKANPKRKAKGVVIEARLDKGKGPIATLLVQSGTLNTGDIIIAGTAVGKVRVMTNDKGRTVKTAQPSVPVEITGLAEVPNSGDIFNAVQDEKLARELAEQRKEQVKAEKNSQITKVTLDNLFSQIAQGSVKELPIIVKADVQGSVEAVRQSLEKISNEEVRVRVIHGGVGAIKESDVMLANASNAIIVGFNVRPDPIAAESAARDQVDMRMYRIIYDAIEEIEQAMKGMLAPKFKEVILGRIEVRQVYKITNVGMVAGSYVLSGKVTREAEIRVVRDGIVIAEDKISSLQRFKDSVKEVASGYECGITLEKFSDLKDGDIFEAFINEEIKQ
ncbi:MAG: translation initiation factor IF-2 [Oscillospiraceae bacterium]|jgi:translation initiation factor IF-2|nr:translation initiation factor IF-2 [Oscillospiraceae bacterium]